MSENDPPPPRASRPDGGAAERYRGRVRCPWCGATDTRLASLFGGTVSEILFECLRCHTPFGVMKWDTLADEASGDTANATSGDA